MNQKKQKHHAFTLVELIVVIVILSILATIAFLSFSSQSSSARDSTRLADISNISKGLGVYSANSGTYPKPDSSVTITASGILIGYQGYAGITVQSIAKLSANGGKDPLDGSFYTYSVNANQNKMQLLGFLEDGNNAAISLVPFSGEDTNADNVTNSGRFILSRGDSVGIILSSGSMMPLQSIYSPGSQVEVANTNTWYTALFSSKDSINGTGSSIFSNIYNRRSELLQNKIFAASDPSLILYWDMETLTGTKLKDLSSRGNDGTCYDGTVIINCNLSGSGPQIVDGNGKTGKAMKFDGMNDSIDIGNINLDKGFTFFVIMKKNGTDSGGGYVFNNNQFFLRTQPSVEDVKGPFEAFINMTGNSPEPRLRSRYSDNNVYAKFLIVWNTNDFRMYGNEGNILAANTRSGTMNASGEATIGRGTFNSNNFFGNYFYGDIDELRIYDRALTNTEISSLYNSVR